MIHEIGITSSSQDEMYILTNPHSSNNMLEMGYARSLYVNYNVEAVFSYMDQHQAKI